jgi:hypothetical protein
MGTSGYQSPQRYYQGASSGSSPSYYQPRASAAQQGYYGANSYQTQASAQRQPQKTAVQNKPSDNGFYLSAGLSRQYSQWNFEMSSAKSVLNYGDTAWNVLDVKGGYKYGDWILDGGVQYGMQAGSGTMTDDDITGGGIEVKYYDAATGDYTASTYTKVLSIGESKGGSMLGLNLGVGLANRFGFGNVKITPSAGYRMFGYSMETSKNNGLAVTNIVCRDEGGSQYCPAMIHFNDGQVSYTPSNGYSDWYDLPSGVSMVSNGDTYSFYQPGTSHLYDVSWNGPYVAAAFESKLNDNNFVEARIELGLPGYSAEGDQPYRQDWAHPKSVEDYKGMFGALHLGLAANWTTMLNANWGVSLGLTYDYYSVSGADSVTNLNGDFYMAILQDIWDSGSWADEAAMYANDPTAASIADLYTSCGESWTCSLKSEISSFYRSVGIRVGIAGKF